MVFGMPESYVSRKNLVTDAAGLTAINTRLTGVSITFLSCEPPDASKLLELSRGQIALRPVP